MGARRKRVRERRRRLQTSTPRATIRADELRETETAERLAYSRRQAAEVLGVSISTIDRRVVPLLDTVKTPWGQRLIPVDELKRFAAEYLVKASLPRPRRPPGRPVSLSESLVARIQLEHAGGRSLGEIARTLTAEEVATAHGGRRWWPSTVRSVLLRSFGLPA